jgi:hypothetical protein
VKSVLVRSDYSREMPEGVLALVRRVCDIAGSRNLIDDARLELASAGVIEAVAKHKDAVIFEWLIGVLSLQGISDAAALSYIESHETISAGSIERALNSSPSCPKLAGYHRFYGCNYRKTKDTCTEPVHKPECPLPRHDLRNGRLNQTAYSLFMFFRDVADGDFVGWLDYQLRPVMGADMPGRMPTLSSPVIGPLSHVHGISSKVLSLSMASLLLAGDIDRPEWITAGARMIAVDSLIHNWMHRTGILRLMGADHLYGQGCYQNGGCAELIENISGCIDARHYNRTFPKDFPRFVQYALWKFCAADELNVCNGNRIRDTGRCKQTTCQLYNICARRRLHERQSKGLNHRRPTSPR